LLYLYSILDRYNTEFEMNATTHTTQITIITSLVAELLSKKSTIYQSDISEVLDTCIDSLNLLVGEAVEEEEEEDDGFARCFICEENFKVEELISRVGGNVCVVCNEPETKSEDGEEETQAWCYEDNKYAVCNCFQPCSPPSPPSEDEEEEVESEDEEGQCMFCFKTLCDCYEEKKEEEGSLAKLPNEFFEEVFGWKDGEPLVAEEERKDFDCVWCKEHFDKSEMDFANLCKDCSLKWIDKCAEVADPVPLYDSEGYDTKCYHCNGTGCDRWLYVRKEVAEPTECFCDGKDCDCWIYEKEFDKYPIHAACALKLDS